MIATYINEINKEMHTLSIEYQNQRKILNWAQSFTENSFYIELLQNEQSKFDELLSILFEPEQQKIWQERIQYIAKTLLKNFYWYKVLAIDETCQEYTKNFLENIFTIINKKNQQHKKQIQEYKKLKNLLKDYQENQYFEKVVEIHSLKIKSPTILTLLQYLIHHNTQIIQSCYKQTEIQKIQALFEKYNLKDWLEESSLDLTSLSLEKIEPIIKILSNLPKQVLLKLPIQEILESNPTLLHLIIQNIIQLEIPYSFLIDHSFLFMPTQEKEATNFLKNIYLLEKERIPILKIIKEYPESLLQENINIKQLLNLYKQYKIDLSQHIQNKTDLKRSILEDLSIFHTLDIWIEIYGSKLAKESFSILLKNDQTLEKRLWISKFLLEISFQNQIEFEKQMKFKLSPMYDLFLPKSTKSDTLSITINPSIQNHNLLHSFDTKYASKDNLMYLFPEQNITISRIKVLRFLSTNIKYPLEEHIASNLYAACLYGSYLETFEKENIQQEISQFLKQTNQEEKSYINKKTV